MAAMSLQRCSNQSWLADSYFNGWNSFEATEMPVTATHVLMVSRKNAASSASASAQGT
jgi:hypothetical protein